MSRSRSKKRKSIKAVGRDGNGSKRMAIENTNDVTWIPTTTACYICQLVKDEDLTILCDGEDCSKEVHLYCLQPPLLCIPSGKWYCDTCSPFGTTKSFLKYLQHHECAKSLYLNGVRIDQPEFAENYHTFMNSLRSKVVKNIEELGLVLDEDLPPSEFVSLSLVGCRVDIWNTLDSEVHSGRILAERMNQKLEKEHLIQFRSGVNGRNSPLIVWLVLQEHISVVYRDIFMLRYGHSCLWQPVQCALRSGLYRLYDRRDLPSSLNKKARNRRKSVNSKHTKNRKSRGANSDDSESSDNDNDDNNNISKNVSMEMKAASITSDLAFFSFIQPDFIVLESVPQNNCRPFFNWDYHSLRLNKATLFALIEARAEAEEQFSVVEKVKHRSLEELETIGLLDMDNGVVNTTCLSKIADQYRNNWKGITLPFGLSGNAYGNFVRKAKSSSLLSSEEEQLANFQQDIEVFQQSEKLLMKERMLLHYQERIHQAPKLFPIVLESLSNSVDSSGKFPMMHATDDIYDLIKSEVHGILQSICDNIASNIDAYGDEVNDINSFGKTVNIMEEQTIVNDDYNGDKEIKHVDMKCSRNDVDKENMDAISEYDVIIEDTVGGASGEENLIIAENDEKETKTTILVKEMDVDDSEDIESHIIINETTIDSDRTNNNHNSSNTNNTNKYEIDEEKEYESRLTSFKQFRELSVNNFSSKAQNIKNHSHIGDMSSYFLDPTFFFISPNPSQTVQLHHLQPCESLCTTIDQYYQAELTAEQARQEAERLEKQRLKKVAAAAIRSEKQRKQKENAEKRRLAAIERKQAKDILLKEMYHQDASTYNNEEPTSPDKEELNDEHNTNNTQLREKMTRRTRKPMLVVSEMIINDSFGDAMEREEDNWKLMDDMDMEMEGENWENTKEQDLNTKNQIETAKPARLLSELNRIDWFDQIVSFSSFPFSSSVSSGVQYGRVVGCDAGMAIVKLSGGVLQHISPVQLEIIEKNSREYIKFSMTDALEEDDAERHVTIPQQPPADLGDQLLSEPINDFIPVDFSFDIANPTINSNAQLQPPQFVKRKPPPPERKIRVIDFAALLTQNEDKDPSVETQKKPVRQPLLQAVKLDQITQQKKLVSSHVTTGITPANKLTNDNILQVDEKEKTAGAQSHVDAANASLPVQHNSGSQNTIKPSTPSTLLNTRKPSMFNVEIKKYGRGVGSVIPSSTVSAVGLTTAQSTSNSSSVAAEKGQSDKSDVVVTSLSSTSSRINSSSITTIDSAVSGDNSIYATSNSDNALLAKVPVKSSRWSSITSDKPPIAVATMTHRSMSEEVVNDFDKASNMSVEEKTVNMPHPAVHTTNNVSSIIPPSTSNYLNITVDSLVSNSSVSQSTTQPLAGRKSRFGSRSEVTNANTTQTQSTMYDTSQNLSHTLSMDHSNMNASTVCSEFQLPTLNSYDTNIVNLSYVQKNILNIRDTVVSYDIPISMGNNQESFGNTMYANSTSNIVDNSFNTPINQPSSMKSTRRSRFSNVTDNTMVSQDDTMNNNFPMDQTSDIMPASDNMFMSTRHQQYDASGVFIPQSMAENNMSYPSALHNSYDMSHNVDTNTNNVVMNVVNNDHTVIMTDQFMPHPTHAMHGYGDSVPETPSILSMTMPHTGYTSYDMSQDLNNNSYALYPQNTSSVDQTTVRYLSAPVGDVPNYPQYFPDNTDTNSSNNNINLPFQATYSSMMYNNNHKNDIDNNSYHRNNVIIDNNHLQINSFGLDHNMYNVLPVEQHVHNIINNNTNNNLQNKNRDPRRNKNTKTSSNSNSNNVTNNNASRIVRIDPPTTNNNNNAGNKTINKNSINSHSNNNQNNNYHDGLTKSQRRRLRRQEKQDQFQRSLQQLDEEMHHIGSVLSHDHQNTLNNSNNNAKSMFTIDMVDLEDGEVCEDYN